MNLGIMGMNGHSKFPRSSELELQLWYSRNTNTNISGNIIKDDLRLQWTNERTHFFIRIYLSHFILGSVDAFVVSERWVERQILRERTSSSHIFFQEPGVPMLIGCVSFARLWFSAFSKTDRVVLITWSPSSYTSVRPECPDAPLSFCSLIKMWQLTKHTGSLGTNRKFISYVIKHNIRCNLVSYLFSIMNI